LLERTLDDSANRRTILPESFLITDELLKVTLKLIRNLNVNQEAINRNLETYAPFAMTERIMMLAGKKGADRQEMHELLRQHALVAWQAVQQGQPNPLIQNLQNEPILKEWITPEEIQQLSVLDSYIGFAQNRSKMLVEEIRSKIQ